MRLNRAGVGWGLGFWVGFLAICPAAGAKEPAGLRVCVNADRTFQAIDGFGVNINPAQWREGNLRPVLDRLVGDLGCTLVRFAPTGLADWLDPARRNAEGVYPPAYLSEVYNSKVFRDAWATFRALNARGLDPFFSVSGRIPGGLGRRDDPRRLGDFGGYAEMVVTIWMTEYGDLDQTGRIEHEVGWRSTRRLLRSLNEGFSAGLVWDAFDNLHEHDGAWSTYGLLATDVVQWRYSPKPRYYAARQVYRFVRPGFVRVATEPVRVEGPPDPYAAWHDPFRHVPLCAFVSPDRRDFTIVGTSELEADTPLTVSLHGLAPEAMGKQVHCFLTGCKESCKQAGRVRIQGQGFRVTLKEHTVFTLTTLDESLQAAMQGRWNAEPRTQNTE